MYESDDYTKDDYTNKLGELTKTFNETSPEYFEAVEKEREGGIRAKRRRKNRRRRASIRERKCRG